MENQEISGREMDLEPRRNRSFWLQTRALLRKNLLMKWRQRWSTLAEILLPVLIMGILVPIRVKAPKEFVPADLHTFNTSHFNQFGSAWALSAYLEKTDSIIGIAPDNEFNRKIAQLLPKVAFNLRHRIRLFESNEAVEKYVSDKRYPDYEEFKPLKAAVIIEKGELYKFNLTIRMNGTGFPPDAPLTSGPAVNKLQVGFNPSNFFIYLARSFAMIQDIFEEAIIYLTRLELGKPPDYRPWSKSIAFRPFPNDDYNQDLFGDAIRSNIGLFLTIAYLWPVTRILRALVGEKESRMSEIMKIMGLYEWSLFVSWLVTYLIISAVQALLIAGITYGTVFAYSNPFLIFLYFFSFGISVFCFSNFLSAFFSKANLASTFGAIIFFLTFFVYLAENSSDSHSVYIKLATCLVPSVCVAHGASPLFDLESASIGLQFSNIFETFDSFKVAYTILMLLFDGLIFLILGGYFKQVFPGSFGIGRRWYFPFESIINLCADKSKTGRRYSSYAPLLSTNIDPDDVSMEVCEEDSLKIEHVDANGKTVGVRIRNLRKDFSREGMENLIAVNNLSLDVYEDQVLALLGHNGAGKTTTLSMLTGLIPASSGDVEIYGKSISSEIDQIRNEVGICPQHDVLFDFLTVKEHLHLFGILKGLNPKEVENQAKSLITEVGLKEKENTASSALSGGQKRKLSLAIAFIGGSRFIVIDEPTSGMDPYSRRSAWELIKKYRLGRTILLTTHFMDEADQLGDRIVIMSKGKIECCGSSLFLKKVYGVGYTMVITTTADADEEKNAKLISLILNSIPSSELLSSFAREVAFRFPFEEVSKFPDLFDELDRDRSSSGSVYGVQSYGISVTTLEEVFLRVRDDLSGLSRKPSTSANEKQSSENIEPDYQNELSTLIQKRIKNADRKSRSVENLWLRHLGSLLSKRWHDAKRDRKVVLWQFLYPILLLVVGVVLVKFTIPKNFHPFELSIANEFPIPDHIVISSLQKETSKSFANLFCSNLDEGAQCIESGVETPDDLSQYLFDSRHDFEFSRFGAIAFWDGSDYHSNRMKKNISSLSFMVFANTTSRHAVPTYLNLVNSARLRALTGSKNSGIRLSSQSFPFTASQQTLNNATLALIIVIAFAFIPASFGAYIVKERVSKAKHIQFISGVSVSAYWMSNLLWDVLCFSIPSIILIVLLYSFHIEPLIGSENITATLCCIVLYGLSVIPFTYLITFFRFSDRSSAQNFLLLLYIISGLSLLIASIVMKAIPKTKKANDVLIYFYHLLPNFSFAYAISNLMVRKAFVAFPDRPGPFALKITGTSCIYMLVESIIYFLLVFALEGYANSYGGSISFHKILKRTKRFMNLNESSAHSEEDESDADVAKEQNRISSGITDHDLIILDKLRKVYPGKAGVPAKVAVKNLSFGIPAGECFGFLGVNGAGKTTTLKMLTLDEAPTSGKAFLNGLDIQNDRNKVRHYLGYCPQFDALIENMTSREHLRLYSSIKGVPKEEVEEYVSQLIQELGLEEYADLPCKGYSGGNKRKLSVGIALVGDPPIVLLDEPSTGMDPGVRRSMWNLIANSMKGRSVILTTHSMEECEALCARIAIMDSGQLRCIGSSQHLKFRYGNGYQLEVNLPENFHRSFEQFVRETFPGSSILEEQNMNLKMMIPKTPALSLATLFRLIISESGQFCVSEYSISETSLEQIFLRFARHTE